MRRPQPTVYGNAQRSCGFICVANAVQANLVACESKATAGLAINVGMRYRYTLNQTP